MRLTQGGRIDRSVTLPFTFDGQAMTGHPGDTLASALLANGVRLVGRSFKYHRPRGLLTAGPEEPNALMEIGAGAARRPNIRATVQELFSGLEAHSQNAWPSLRYDALSLNDLAWPLLPAGFYYKTFLWPAAFWERVYEPAIRRAAGLGRFNRKPDPAPHEKVFAQCDLLVIGGGAAGLMAAATAVDAGADVILVDDSAEPGGRLLSDRETVDDKPGDTWATELAARLAAAPNLRLLRRTTVTGAYDHGVYGAYERVAEHLPVDAGTTVPRAAFWRITARAAVLATGALERPIAFPNNDRPGVMLASAVRSYVTRYGVAPGRRVALFAANDDAYRTVDDLRAAGLRVVAVIDPREVAPDHDGVRVYAGARAVGTSGRRSLNGVDIETAQGPRHISADVLALSGGWTPSVHLSSHLGARPTWDDAKQVFLPSDGAVPGLFPCGSAAGHGSTQACLETGVDAARAALDAIGLAAAGRPVPSAPQPVGSSTPVWHIPGPGRAWLDFQNDVTTKDVALAAQEGFVSVEHMKRYTTQGMAPDQGKSSNIAALAVLAEATQQSIPETGTTTYRPPFAPVPLAALGAGAEQKGFAPERLTSTDAASRALGAPMIEAGLWYRPSYFPAPGEKTWRQSCDREVRMVREAVGVCDVSTLGKIAFQGLETGAFLDFVYANRVSTLKPGRVRYGIMLREDGHVMDDGTIARLSDDTWVMTTTTAAAGQVMQHLEFAQQCHRPRLRTRFTSTTDAWAQFAIAGPRSREALDAVLDTPLDPSAWPFMACGAVTVAGVAGRLFRISFSGEHAYELAVPARYGAALFERLLAVAAGLGGGPYGMEALNVLRIEKGFLTHAELHGRTTAFDLGLQGMMSTKKDFIGRAAASRPGLMDPDRERLVGLVPLDPKDRILAGAQLYATGASPVSRNGQGYVTSTGYSPSLGHDVALGFLSRGPARHGETLTMLDQLRGVETPCRVTPPMFVDPEGGRARD